MSNVYLYIIYIYIYYSVSYKDIILYYVYVQIFPLRNQNATNDIKLKHKPFIFILRRYLYC